jgi:hypothetical protein
MRARLRKLEAAAAAVHRAGFLPVEMMNDSQLWAIIRHGHPELPADVDQLSDGMLQAIIDGQSPLEGPNRDEGVGHRRPSRSVLRYCGPRHPAGAGTAAEHPESYDRDGFPKDSSGTVPETVLSPVAVRAGQADNTRGG